MYYKNKLEGGKLCRLGVARYADVMHQLKQSDTHAVWKDKNNDIYCSDKQSCETKLLC